MKTIDNLFDNVVNSIIPEFIYEPLNEEERNYIFNKTLQYKDNSELPKLKFIKIGNYIKISNQSFTDKIKTIELTNNSKSKTFDEMFYKYLKQYNNKSDNIKEIKSKLINICSSSPLSTKVDNYVFNSYVNSIINKEDNLDILKKYYNDFYINKEDYSDIGRTLSRQYTQKDIENLVRVNTKLDSYTYSLVTILPYMYKDKLFIHNVNEEFNAINRMEENISDGLSSLNILYNRLLNKLSIEESNHQIDFISNAIYSKQNGIQLRLHKKESIHKYLPEPLTLENLSDLISCLSKEQQTEYLNDIYMSVYDNIIDLDKDNINNDEMLLGMVNNTRDTIDNCIDVNNIDLHLYCSIVKLNYYTFIFNRHLLNLSYDQLNKVKEIDPLVYNIVTNTNIQ